MSKVAKLPIAQSAPDLPYEVYREAVDQADVAISITDAAANILYSNDAFTRATGYSRAAAQGQNQSQLSYKATPPRIYTEMWSTLQQGLSWHGRLLNRRQDGNPYLAELSITPVRAADGSVHHYLGMHRDVTSTHQLEQRVLNQKQLIESVIDAAPMAIALLDDTGKVVLDNQAYKKLITDLGTTEPAELLLTALGKAPIPGNGGGIEIRIDRPGRRAPRWFSCTTQLLEIRDESADGFFDVPRQPSLLLIASDISALHEEQEKARAAALKAMLAEEESAATLHESLSAALYQIEEPINVIASAVALMRGRDDRDRDRGVSGVLETALAGARKRIEELRAMLPTTQRDDQSNETDVVINLNEVVRDVLEIVTPRLLASGITVDWQPQPVLPVLLGHPLKIRIAVKSLIDNAIDAISGMRHPHLPAKREISLTTHESRDAVMLTLDDSGPGIPAELRLKVFEPFFSARGHVGRHLGTGLARAQQIIAEHGGSVDILDAPRGGCRIRVDLPIERGAP